MRWLGAVATVVFLVMAGTALAVPHGTTILLDRPTGFGALPFDGVSEASVGPHAISANGCYVVFSSSNDVLLATDENSATNVYRLDRCTAGHPLVQVNTSAAGEPADAGSDAGSASVSADGNYVAFYSTARNLVAGADGEQQFMVKNMTTGVVELASKSDDGTLVGNGGTSSGVISGNGRALAFTADNAFKGQNTDGLAGQTNAYVRFLDLNHTVLVSVKSDGTAGGGVRGTPDLSSTGDKAAFVTTNGLYTGVNPDNDGEQDAYLATNVLAGAPATTWVTYTSGNTAGANSANDVAISNDGTWVGWTNDNHPWYTQCPAACNMPYQGDFNVPTSTPQNVRDIGFGYSAGAPTHVFWSTDQPLVAGDTNNASDLYTHLLSDPGATGISLLTTGTYAGGVFDGRATDDGSVVAFDSGSTDLPGASTTAQVYVRAGGQTTLISQPEGLPARVGEVRDAYPENLHAISSGGGRVVYTSASPFLGVTLLGNRYPSQVFARAVTSGLTTPVSVTPGGALGNDDAYYPSMDGSGDRIAFVSQATDLVPGVAPGFQHVYVRDLAAGTTTLVDRTAGGAVSAKGADAPQISGDGRRVVFTSLSDDLPGYDGNDHVYVVELATGTITQADTTAAATAGNASAANPDISADGSRVAFISRATNLGGNSVPGRPSAYVKDLSTGELTWASVPQDAATDHSESVEVALSGDGRHVAFADDHPQLGYGSDGRLHVYVRDLAAQSTVRGSVGTSGSGLAEQRFPSINNDGTRLTFTEYDPNRSPFTFLRDLSTNATVTVTDGRFGSFVASISASGNCVAFGSRSDDIVSPSYGPDFDHVYLRAIGGDCPPDTGGPGPGPTPGPAADTTRPVLSKLRMTNRRFAVSPKRTAVSARKRAKRGTAFLFRLSENARTTITISRAATGRRSGRRCVRPRKGLRKKCTRYVNVVTLKRAKTRSGNNRVAFTGRWSRRAKDKLTPGRYRATLVATDAAGNRSSAKRITFRVVRR